MRNAEKFGDGRIFPVQRGLGDAPALMSLRTENGNIGSTRFDPDATDGTGLSIVTLDGWCREHRLRPDFIKMDLESWEMAALRGGRAIITECRPRLAVCLYHSLFDMWTIPHLLKRYARPIVSGAGKMLRLRRLFFTQRFEYSEAQFFYSTPPCQRCP